MTFKLDEQTLTLSGRVGESLNLTFEFEEDISQMHIEFVISEKMGSKPTLRRSFKKPSENRVELSLSTDEVSQLLNTNDTHSTYCWGLMAHIGKNYSSIIIPELLKSAPKLLIYPGININLDEIDSGDEDGN